MAEYNPSKIVKDGNTYNFRDTTKIPLAGSNQISGSLIPATTAVYDLGGFSYQWNNAYIKSLTINGVACGDILTHNASEFVNVTGVQTIGGAKTFYTSTTAYPIIKLKTAFIEQGLYDSDNLRGVAFRCADKNDAILGDFGYKTERTGEVGSYFSARTKVNNTQTTREVKLRFKPGSTDCELVPDTTNAIDLGNSALKWKSFNGVNPGALSLQGTGVIDVSSNITVLDGTTQNKFTPQINGWLHINGTGPMSDGFIYAVQGRVGMKSANNPSYGRCAVLIPVVAGVELSVTCKLTTLTWANITPCQGNV